MTRFQEMISTPSLTAERGPIRIGRLTAMYLGTILLIGVVAVAALTFAPSAESPTTTATSAGEVIDGWLPGITAANREKAAGAAAATVDGWASALLKPELPAVDGWASALLKPEPAVVDGWASRYLVDDED